MQFLGEQLDDPHAAPCGRCSRCTGQALPAAVASEVVAAASRRCGGTWEGAVEALRRGFGPVAVWERLFDERPEIPVDPVEQLHLGV
ncbi:MAG TPA: hypothetical protein VM324_02940 [Egibacteraceae bacterium]|jgi:hypothetical protein|nr:hypothetical protein [Egibacteraceae bacterium]